MAASIEQVTANTASLSASVARDRRRRRGDTASIQSVDGHGQEMASAAAAGDRVDRPRWRPRSRASASDTEALTASVNETAAAIEEMARSIQGVAGNADD